MVDDQPVELAIWDPLGGQQDYSDLRPLSYPGSNVILICFSIERADSLTKIKQNWIPEILHFCSNPPVPYILVGCKKDLRLDQDLEESLKRTGKGMVTVENAERVARDIGAAAYLECSAITGEGVAEVFEHAARISRCIPKRKHNLTCRIL
jgi:Ras family protein A